MKFTVIKRTAEHISLSEWEKVIASLEFLTQMPCREGTNPITGEKIVSKLGRAAYVILNDEIVGNVSLDQGKLIATNVPLELCVEISNILDAEISATDIS